MSWPPKLPPRYIMWPRPERALVGKGSFGEVWRAKDEHQGVLVALKILRARDARVQTRMEREAALAAKVVHPNVISLYDMGRTPEGLPYLAFPMASDGNLRRILGDPPPWPELLDLLGDLLAALAALHSRGFLHLDVKLDNVLLHRAGARRRNVWLADLGVAIALYSDDDDERLIAGTVGYMPAEQLAGQHHLWGPSTDLFAFGALAYRLLCGEFPFPQKEPVEAHAARYRPPMTLPVMEDYVVPPGIDDVILPLLHPSPRGRYDQAADVWRALQGLAPVVGASNPGGVAAEPTDQVSGFLPPPGSTGSGETGHASGMWGSSSRSNLGGTLYPTADKTSQIQLTPLDVPPWNRPAPRPPPRTLARPQVPKRLSNAAALLVHREVPLVGRDRELDLLWQAGRWVWQKQRPALIQVTGPRGIGRTRLIQEYTRSVEASGFGEGSLLQFARSEGPTTGVRGALRRIIPPHRDHPTYVNEVATLLARDRGSEIEACLSDARVLAGWLVPQEDSEPIDVSRVLDLFVEHLVLRAWRGLAFLWVDDAHLAGIEDPVWDLIERVYKKGAPVLVILSTASEQTTSAVEHVVARHKKSSHEIALQPMSESAAAALVRSYLPLEIDLARQIGVQTGGNPKYAREVLIHWVRAGILLSEEGSEGAAPVWSKAKVAPPFPKDRQAFAQQCLAHAIAHDPSRLRALLALTEADEGAPERVLARVAGEMLDLLVVEGLVEIEQGRPRLVPPELADAVRAWPREPELGLQVHRDLAKAWESEGSEPEVLARVGRHLALAGEYARALEPLTKALKALKHVLAVPALIEWARLVRDVASAADQVGSPSWGYGALTLADAIWRTGDVAGAMAELEGILDSPKVYVGDRFRAACRAAIQLTEERQLDDALHRLAEAERMLHELPAPFKALWEASRALAYLRSGALPFAMEHAQAALRSNPDPETRLLALLVTAEAAAAKKPLASYDEIKLAIDLSKEQRDLEAEARATGLAARAEALQTRGDSAAGERVALGRLELLGEMLRLSGEGRAHGETLLQLADCLRIRGELVQAEAHYARAEAHVARSTSLTERLRQGRAIDPGPTATR